MVKQVSLSMRYSVPPASLQASVTSVVTSAACTTARCQTLIPLLKALPEHIMPVKRHSRVRLATRDLLSAVRLA